MAFGLDVVDLIYTDADFVDAGTLADYEVDLDLAGSKDFELITDEYILSPGSLWYVDGTEFGGIVDGFTTDPRSYQIRYKGRSFRGILDSKILYSSNLKNVIQVSGRLHVIINQLLECYGLSNMFVCDEAELDANGEVSDTLNGYELDPGQSLYAAMEVLADEVGNVAYELAYNINEKLVHILPVVPEDHTDYISYCEDNSISFTISKNKNITNHLICSGVDENAKRRTIHLFTNEGGELQPYLKDGVSSPSKDSDYILDTRNQVLSGVSEIAEFYDGSVSVDTNYELVTQKAKPSDWDTSYSKEYYKKVITPKYGEEIIRTVSNNSSSTVSLPDYFYDGEYIVMQGQNMVTPTRSVKENGRNVPKKNYWLLNPVKVAIINFSDSYIGYELTVNGAKKEVPASGELIVNYSGDISKFVISDYWGKLDVNYDYSIAQKSRSKVVAFRSEYKGQKVSLYEVLDIETSYEPLAAEVKDTYTILTSQPPGWNAIYSYFYTRSWSQADSVWEYSAVTSTSKTDMDHLTRITSNAPPADWASNYDQYYFKYSNGNAILLHQYQAESKDRYIKMKNKPYDWDSGFTSYYVFSQKKYESVEATKSGKAPTFKANKYYRKESYSVKPKYNKANCYLPATKVIAPSWSKEKYFSKTTKEVPPTYKSGVYYRAVYDHYRSLVSGGLSHLSSLSAEDSQTVKANEINLAIGDTVGGYDEQTKTEISQVVTNKIVKIKRGVLTTEYEIGGER